MFRLLEKTFMSQKIACRHFYSLPHQQNNLLQVLITPFPIAEINYSPPPCSIPPKKSIFPPAQREGEEKTM